MRGLSLTILRGRFAGHAVPLGATPVILGREGATIYLESKLASVRHAEIRADGGGLLLRDLGSAIGTRVNGAPVSARLLAPGDLVEIGEDAFRVDNAVAPPRALLIETRGAMIGRAFPVVATALSMGRDADCTVVIASARASRRHCEIRPETTGLFLHDLGSGNGTFVNGERIRARELRPGDLIDVGDEQFRIDAPMASLPAATPPASAHPAYAETAIAPPVAAYASPPAQPTPSPARSSEPTAGGPQPSRAKSPLARSMPGPMETTVRCPRCGRAVDPRLQDCPWDGAALVNGKTFF